MTILSRIFCFVAVVVLAFVIFSKPREIVTTEQPAEKPQVSTPPQPPPTPRSRPRAEPLPKRPAAEVIEPEQPNQTTFRPLEKPPQAPRRVRDPDAYKWEQTFNTALMETDRSKRQERIDAAQAAINRRLQELDAHDSPEERRAIGNAQLGLNMLNAEASNNSESR